MIINKCCLSLFILMIATMAHADINDGLVGHWTLDEGQGTEVKDSSAQGGAGTLGGASLPQWVAQEGGFALDFNGSTSLVSIKNTSSLNNLASFTYSVWINPRSGGQANLGRILGRSLTTLRMFFGTRVNFIAYCSPTLINSAPPSNLIKTNQWNHVVVQWNGQCGDSGEITFVINGVSNTYTQLGAGTISSDASNLSVGLGFDGLIDNVRIYNRLLEPSEITTLHDLGPSPRLIEAYWVSPTGTASWNNCKSIVSLEGVNACSLSTANANVAAGDMVYLRGGTYVITKQYGSALSPVNSGTAGKWITFARAPGENPEIKGVYGTRMWGFIVQAVSYIKIDGIIFSDFSDTGLVRASAHHIELSNNTFRNVTSPYRGGGVGLVESCAGGSPNNCPVSNIWIHHNTFYKLAAGGGCGTSISEGGDALRIGYPSNVSPKPTGNNSNITIEHNYMAYAGHAVMDSYGQYVVIKDNVAHNEPWYPADNGACHVNHQPVYTNWAYDGLYGHRVWQITDTYSREGVFNLIENNRVGHGGVNPNNNGAESMAIASSKNILRYNSFYGSMNYGIMPKYGPAGYSWQSIGGLNNRIYNNTILKNGYGYPFFQTCTNKQLATCPQPLYGITYYYPSLITGNIIKNNIVYGNYGAVEKGMTDIAPSNSGNSVENNWQTPDGDPLFQNPDLTQTTSLVFPDLHLKSDSKAINTGMHLTTVSFVQDQTRITLADPLFFQDGTWGAEMTRNVTLFPDWIAIGDPSNVVQIKSIDYGNGNIELASIPKVPIKPSDRVWLYKKSDGSIILKDASPDMGAYEFVSDTSIQKGSGDVSGDAKVTMYDAALALRFTLGSSLTDAQKTAADMNADGKVDGTDVVMIAKRALGLN